jgi:hypothetical protein
MSALPSEALLKPPLGRGTAEGVNAFRNPAAVSLLGRQDCLP